MSLGLIYLDMNVYADVEQAASEAQLRNALESRRLRAVCSVELVQEAAVISDVGRRTRRMRTIRRVSSVDLDPCLSSETRELVDELRAHVPGWIRHVPARARSMQLVRRWRQWLKGPFDPVHLDALATLRRDEIAKNEYLRRHETGNLGDLGHCSYLRDVAVFVTSDRALAASIARVPVEIRHARICLVRSDHTDLEAGLDAALQAHDSQM